jgi:hypothetical protein
MGSAAQWRGAYGREYMRAELCLRTREVEEDGPRSNQTRARKDYTWDHRLEADQNHQPYPILCTFIGGGIRKLEAGARFEKTWLACHIEASIISILGERLDPERSQTRSIKQASPTGTAWTSCGRPTSQRPSWPFPRTQGRATPRSGQEIDRLSIPRGAPVLHPGWSGRSRRIPNNVRWLLSWFVPPHTHVCPALVTLVPPRWHSSRTHTRWLLSWFVLRITQNV